ncbi:hypothetical protein HOG98_03735 [bacterium]|jgi:hypothetical protein|nr:hypothetical protein [bacterium]
MAFSINSASAMSSAFSQAQSRYISDPSLIKRDSQSIYKNLENYKIDNKTKNHISKIVDNLRQAGPLTLKNTSSLFTNLTQMDKANPTFLGTAKESIFGSGAGSKTITSLLDDMLVTAKFGVNFSESMQSDIGMPDATMKELYLMLIKLLQNGIESPEELSNVLALMGILDGFIPADLKMQVQESITMFVEELKSGVTDFKSFMMLSHVLSNLNMGGGLDIEVPNLTKLDYQYINPDMILPVDMAAEADGELDHFNETGQTQVQELGKSSDTSDSSEEIHNKMAHIEMQALKLHKKRKRNENDSSIANQALSKQNISIKRVQHSQQTGNNLSNGSEGKKERTLSQIKESIKNLSALSKREKTAETIAEDKEFKTAVSSSISNLMNNNSLVYASGILAMLSIPLETQLDDLLDEMDYFIDKVMPSQF